MSPATNPFILPPICPNIAGAAYRALSGINPAVTLSPASGKTMSM